MGWRPFNIFIKSHHVWYSPILKPGKMLSWTCWIYVHRIFSTANILKNQTRKRTYISFNLLSHCVLSTTNASISNRFTTSIKMPMQKKRTLKKWRPYAIFFTARVISAIWWHKRHMFFYLNSLMSRASVFSSFKCGRVTTEGPGRVFFPTFFVFLILGAQIDEHLITALIIQRSLTKLWVKKNRFWNGHGNGFFLMIHEENNTQALYTHLENNINLEINLFYLNIIQ